MNKYTAVLEPVGKGKVVLETVDIEASLQGLYSNVVVTQTYRNPGRKAIEAVYTFPLPLDAVLLELVMTLNGKTMRGVVRGKNEAEEEYENAIEDGNTAILLEEVEPGIFTINIANILPKEQVKVQFRFAQLHQWQGQSLRFSLPTTIAPRYGDPLKAGMDLHQIPEYSLTIDRGFSMNLKIRGTLADSDLECPSHPVKVARNNDCTEISLSGGSALMDRDFILVLKEPLGQNIEGIHVPDGKRHVAIASFHPVSTETEVSPRCIKLVVDCSGSMYGDSIQQARAALVEIMSKLNSSDYFNLITFGTGYNMLFEAPVAANRKNLRRAATFLEGMDADMGGTEIGEALNAAYTCGTIEGLQSDILLITDGEVRDDINIVIKAQKSGHRIFTIGVGSAVSEALLRRLADVTSAACELVSPRENMSEKIVRHFQRIDQPNTQSIHIDWPVQPVRQIPKKIHSVFSGDTLHVIAWFREVPKGTARLTLSFNNGKTLTQEAGIVEEVRDELVQDLPRLAAYERLSCTGSKKAARLAERYQLITEHTSCVLVYERSEEEKTGELPEIHTVPQALAAGWGGTGSVLYSLADRIVDPLTKSCRMTGPVYDPISVDDEELEESLHDRIINYNYKEFTNFLNDIFSDQSSGTPDIKTIDALKTMGLSGDVVLVLSELDEDIGEVIKEEVLVMTFLKILSFTKYRKKLAKEVIDFIDREFMKIDPPDSLIDTITEKLSLF